MDVASHRRRERARFARVGVADDFEDVGVIWPTDEVPVLPDLPAE